MSETVDDMMDGTLCQRCAAYIGEEVGYPRLCRECQKEFGREDKGDE